MGAENDQRNSYEEQNRANSTSDEPTAQQHFIAGRFGESAAIYAQLCSNLPERLDIRARLGYLALLANDLDAAVKHLSQAINLGERSQRTLTQLAEAYYRQGRLGSAAYCYQRLGREGLAGTLAVMQDIEVYQLSHSDVSLEIPWLAAAPLPVIEVEINGRKANMVLDTGAGDTVIDTRLALDA
ncbi:MAG: aspartyl protease family protein, partial [Gammaproteobacteria bacterium]|nr:aspartyl protease family protein [Gammaproteobacteria bacterium]